MLSFSQVIFSVSSTEKPILHDINFTIHPREFVVILGSNGSGKSSLLKLISGDYLVSGGKIKNEAKNLSYLSQDTSHTLFHDLTVLENCCLNEQKMCATPFKLSTKLEQTEYERYLKNFHPHLSTTMNTVVGILSAGERQSLALGLVLKKNPDLLLRDEHTSALDPKTSGTIMQLTNQAIQDRGLTALMVIRSLQKALDFGTRVIALKEGEIILDYKKNNHKKLTQEELVEIYSQH